jgi:hypothetical protein
MTERRSLSMSRSYLQGTHEMKPRGLWYSIGKEWINWCNSEMPGWISKYNHILDIDTSRILIISTGEDVKRLERKYQGREQEFEKWGNRYITIDWDRLSRDFDGIEIRNYYDIRFSRDEESRFSETPWHENLWFGFWDVPSGCIWNLRSLKASTPVLTKNL